MDITNTACVQLVLDERSSVAKFAMSLLSFGLTTINEDECVWSVVNHFDTELFFVKCRKSSLNYDAEVCDFDQISAILFDEGVTWINRDIPFDAIYDVGGRHRFEPIREGCQIFYSRVTRTKKRKSSVEPVSGKKTTRLHLLTDVDTLASGKVQGC